MIQAAASTQGVGTLTLQEAQLRYCALVGQMRVLLAAADAEGERAEGGWVAGQGRLLAAGAGEGGEEGASGGGGGGVNDGGRGAAKRCRAGKKGKGSNGGGKGQGRGGTSWQVTVPSVRLGGDAAEADDGGRDGAGGGVLPGAELEDGMDEAGAGEVCGMVVETVGGGGASEQQASELQPTSASAGDAGCTGAACSSLYSASSSSRDALVAFVRDEMTWLAGLCMHNHDLLWRLCEADVVEGKQPCPGGLIAFYVDGFALMFFFKKAA